MATGGGTVNKVILIGHLGQDPELKYTPSGAAVTNFSLATNEYWKDSDGNRKDHTEWHRIVMWRKLAEIAGEYLKKGSKVYIEGSLRTRSWEDKDGVKRYTTEIQADSMTMLDRKQEGGPQQSSAPQADTVAEPAKNSSDEDDLPF